MHQLDAIRHYEGDTADTVCECGWVSPLARHTMEAIDWHHEHHGVMTMTPEQAAQAQAEYEADALLDRVDA